MDDGWFGRRNDETTSLGDRRVNEEKLPGGLNRLGEEPEEYRQYGPLFRGLLPAGLLPGESRL